MLWLHYEDLITSVRMYKHQNICRGCPLRVVLSRTPIWRTHHSPDNLPQELILLLATFLPPASLNALGSTCRLLRGILQPELEARITPELGKRILLRGSSVQASCCDQASRPALLYHPSAGYGFQAMTPSTAPPSILLQSATTPIPLRSYSTTAAVIDKVCGGAVERAETALHIACIFGHVQMTALLLSRGADTECRGRYGTRAGLCAAESAAKSGCASPAAVARRTGGGSRAAQSHEVLRAAVHSESAVYCDSFAASEGRHCDCPEPLPTERRKDCMALLLAHGAKVGATMEIVLIRTTAEVLRMVESLLSEALEHAHGVRRKVPVSSPPMSNLDAVSCEIAILFRLRIDLPLPEPLRWFYFNTSSEVHTPFSCGHCNSESY
ncbi:hypothetical protein B0H14DRAFT_3033318 [Mycena olivaceomarginata]|nr:hypothetical protein B0H14DRAFT_3033318 [Mycena olivaceomarginata]